MLKKIQALTCLNDKEKLDHVKRKGVGHNDILALAKNCHLVQVNPGAIGWPAACNPCNSKAAPANFGNLAQLPGPTALSNGTGNSDRNQGRN